MQNEITTKEYTTLNEFYVYYLTEHANITSRRLHFVGTGLVIGILLYALLTSNYTLLWCMPLAGYSFAWAGHLDRKSVV